MNYKTSVPPMSQSDFLHIAALVKVKFKKLGFKKKTMRAIVTDYIEQHLEQNERIAYYRKVNGI